jgi:cysteine synthase A
MDRDWVRHAVEALEADRKATADTPLLRLDLPEYPGIHVYLKDETSHPTGSLKHRLAYSLFLHGICNGDIGAATTIVEASSGSTAIAEAWFARLLGLSLVAVVPEDTASAKLDEIRNAGGLVHTVPQGADLCSAAREIARTTGAHFMDQFTNAERVTDWRGNNNIAESIFAQLAPEPHPLPCWIVVGAGTGGTSATIGRYIRLRPELAAVKLCVVDPESSIFWRLYAGGALGGVAASLVEGIGRTHPVASFVPGVIDTMIAVPDAASIAATHWLERRMNRKFGPSTGANLIGILALADLMRARGQSGSLVTLACDPGGRYRSTVYDPAWLKAQGVDLAEWSRRFDRFDHDAVGPLVPLKKRVVGS